MGLVLRGWCEVVGWCFISGNFLGSKVWARLQHIDIHLSVEERWKNHSDVRVSLSQGML